MFEKFTEDMDVKLDERLDIKRYPNFQLAAEVDVTNGIQLSTVDMTRSGETL
ncbi:hypothetical protein L4D76_15695 [Photobacterium sagamiensis]